MTRLFKYLFLTISIICLPLLVLAQNETIQVPSPYQNLRYVLVGVAIFLMIVIVVMGKSIAAIMAFKNQKKRKSNVSNTFLKTLMIGFTLLTAGNTLFAQEAEDVIKEKSWFVTVPADVIVISLIIVFEMVLILMLGKVQMSLVKEEKIISNENLAAKKSYWDIFFTKINNTVELENESSLDMNHDYDGIRELDNKIPKWWLYSFYGTILIGVIYMYRMFVSETMPDQITELHEANRIADIKMKEYLKNAANNVDENTVVMLDAAGIESGKTLYNSMGCATCHGASGEGNSVGPNLTDEYWLHKGSINDIFYSIKYGWPEKGMKSWKDDMSPVQIAQVASYIKSLKGTTPPNPRAPQGELYTESEGQPGDAPQVDSSSVAIAE